MASVGSTNISMVSTQVAQPLSPHAGSQHQLSQTSDSARLAALQRAAEHNSKTVQTDDRKRGVQVPKKTEKSFSLQNHSPNKNAPLEPEEEKDEKEEGDEHLNMLA